MVGSGAEVPFAAVSGMRRGAASTSGAGCGWGREGGEGMRETSGCGRVVGER